MRCLTRLAPRSSTSSRQAACAGGDATTRLRALPDVPTVGDFVRAMTATGLGVGAPKNTPAEIVDKLNRGINAALADPKVKARIADLGSAPTCRLPRRLRQAHRRRNREMGQGHPGRRHQAGVIRAIPAQYSITPVPRSAEPHPRCRSDQIQRRNLIRCDGHRKRSSCALYRSDFRTIQL